ncbi:conserved hypothetical protein [Leishmania mexicana MHOM/GT/2001/U1103]|uniref:Uncharacterized protein n=1 Tax=Leishmania mexicana (strain MHOM/GT/2001/U1103) TaxID=929439 RepID=E9B311_LEIMU|nr:conserved hypothetical protein [Leishmania mexicana MHOM/GT/2001/U1103]CBZ29626.1 conserved hypothetical protein [Leishmania mexicana MHOM/GT/2001/U1103]
MSWVRVECSGGYCYAAPSHGRCVPKLDGMARLFQAPFCLRELHAFTTLSDNAPAISGRNNGDSCGVLGTDESVNACIIVDQRNLGGHLGLTTVTVGDEEDAGVSDSPPLRLLLNRVFAVLCSTSERGVQLLLDALCTRAPPPLTAVASAEAAIVHEDDGGRRVPPALWLARTQEAGSTPQNTSGGVGTSSNRQFLAKLTQGCSTVEGVAGAVETLSLQPLLSDMAAATKPNHAARALTQVASGTASTLPAHPSTAFSEFPGSASQVIRPPLSYAAALRRRSLLFFLPQGVVPLSMLAIHLQLSPRQVKCQQKEAASAPCGGGVSAQRAALSLTGDASTATGGLTTSLHAVLLEELEHVRVGAVRAGGGHESNCASCASAQGCCCAVRVHCVSHLRRHGDKLLKMNSSWAAVARTAEESGRVLMWAIARLLAGSERPMHTSQAMDLRHLILHDLWAREHLTGGEERGTTANGRAASAAQAGTAPLVAVYSPSGLLLASAKFSMLLSHEEQVLLSAAAIDRLARYAAPRSLCRPHASAAAADALSWTSWPMRMGEAAGKPSAAVVMDVLLITVGDALAFCLAFPRTPSSGSAPPLSSLRSVQSLLESAVSKARSRVEVPSTGRSAPLASALVFACTHSTTPYTPTFHDALFAVTALEDALDAAKKTSSGVSANSAAGEQMGVAQYLHQLLWREMLHMQTPNEQGAGAAAENAPAFTSGATSTPHPANVSAAVAASSLMNSTGGDGRHPKRVSSALHKVFSCLPLRHNDSSKGVASRQLYITAAQQQSSTYVNHPSKGVHLSSPIPLLNAYRTQCSNPYAAFLLAMPLEEMLCYVAALVTRNELGTLRPSYELGLHSFFFLQRPVAAAAAKHRHAASAKASGSQMWQTASAAAQPPAPPTRFGVSFARFRLQQSSCTHAVIPEEWADADGAPDGSGGRLAFFEDPSLLLRLHTHGVSLEGNTVDGKRGEGEGSERAYGDTSQWLKESSSVDVALETQVSVVPVWTLLQAVPDESLATRERSGSDTETSDSDCFAAANDFRGVHRFVPSSVDEDVQLVTSLHYAYPQRLCHRKPAASPVNATLSTPPPASAQHTSSSALPHPQPSDYLPQASATDTAAARPKKDSVALAWCQVEAVVSICGDITGTRQSIMAKALQRHALSRSAEAELMGTDHKHGSGGASALFAAVAPDSLPAEWEYAAGAPPKMADLCREVVWCQEAALALLEGASCAT